MTPYAEPLRNLFIQGIVDPSNLSGVYILKVFRKHFLGRFDKCRHDINQQQATILRYYRDVAADFLTPIISGEDKEARSERIKRGEAD